MKEYFSPITIAITALLATTALTSCTDKSEPGLTLTPIEFGGEHASLLSVITGNSFAYRVQYDGHSTSYRIDMELFEAGELTAKRQLLAGIFADLAQNSIQDESIDMLLAFMVTDPRREETPPKLRLFSPILLRLFIKTFRSPSGMHWVAEEARAIVIITNACTSNQRANL